MGGHAHEVGPGHALPGNVEVGRKLAMVRRTKKRLRVMVPASILALMVGLLFAPTVGAY